MSRRSIVYARNPCGLLRSVRSVPTEISRRSYSTIIAAALTLLPSIAEAGGDAVYGTRGGELLGEREHRIG